MGVLSAVLAFEALDLVETLDLSSLSRVFGRPVPELLDAGRDSDSTSSCTLPIRLELLLRSCDASVSGGLGGRPSSKMVAPLPGR